MSIEKGKSRLPETTWSWKKEAIIFVCAMGAVIVAMSFTHLLAGRNEHKFTLLEKIEERISFAICWPTCICGSFIYFNLFLPERLIFLWTLLSIFSVFLSGLFWTAMVELCFRIKKWTPVWAAWGLFVFIVSASFFCNLELVYTFQFQFDECLHQ